MSTDITIDTDQRNHGVYKGDILVLKNLHVADQLSLRVVGIEDGVGEEVGGAVQAAVAQVLCRQCLTQVLGHLYVHLVNNRQKWGTHTVYTLKSFVALLSSITNWEVLYCGCCHSKTYETFFL